VVVGVDAVGEEVNMTTDTKPKQYIRPMPATWWLHNRHLFLFMIRELTALFVGGYAIFLLIMLYRYSQGPEWFRLFFESKMKSPVVIGLQIVALLFVVYHTITTCTAAPVLMVVWRGDEKLDPKKIIQGNYIAWAVISLVLIVIALIV
jgi:fumarate reductase subunit C